MDSGALVDAYMLKMAKKADKKPFAQLVAENVPIEHLANAFIDQFITLYEPDDDGMITIPPKPPVTNPPRPIANRVLKQLLNRAEVYKERIYIIDNVVVAKLNDIRDNRDNTTSEALVGLELNKYFKRFPAPNFVYTFGEFYAPVILTNTHKTLPKDFIFGQDYSYVATQYIQGERLYDLIHNKDANLTSVMPLLLQAFFSLKEAQDYCEFTHYDAHGGNHIALKIPEGSRVIPYKYGKVKSDKYNVIIDFGRACARINRKNMVGLVSEKYSVSAVMQPFYDFYFILHRVMTSIQYASRHDRHSILSFFGLKEFGELEYDLQTIVKSSYSFDKFVEMLYTLNACKNCLIRPSEEIPQTVVIEEKSHQFFEDPTTDQLYNELNSLRGGRSRTRGRLLKLCEIEQTRIEIYRDMFNRAIGRTPFNLTKPFKVDDLTESKHDKLYNVLKSFEVDKKYPTQMKPHLKQLITFYNDRLRTWINLISKIET